MIDVLIFSFAIKMISITIQNLNNILFSISTTMQVK